MSGILDKIQKCMRLSKSSEPHEAAAALRQAQKLMAAHGVTEHDLNAAGFGNETVNVPIQANKKVPMVLNQLIGLIADAFGVKPVIEREVRISDPSWVIRYFGPLDRVNLATYTHTVVYRAMESSWREHLKAHPEVKGERGARTGFQLGWLSSVREQIEKLAITEKEQAGIDIVQQNHYGRSLAKAKQSNMKVDLGALGAGAAAGGGFRLHRPVGAERLKIKHNKD